MHEIQKKILKLAQVDELSGKNLRQIANEIDEIHLQKIKHHLNALVNKNLLYLNNRGDYQVRKRDDQDQSKFFNLPIYGAANCGVATLYAENSIEGYLQVAKSLLPKINQNKLIVLKAVGESMNKATVNDTNINHGDYLVIDTNYRYPIDGDYVLSIIDNLANIKRYFYDKEQNEVRLVSESTKTIAPIVAKSNDDFSINGKVIKVIKSN